MLPLLGSRIPNTGSGNTTCIVRELGGFPTRRTPDSIANMGVATVKDRFEQIVQQPSYVIRNARVGDGLSERLFRDLRIPHLAICGAGNLLRQLSEGQHAGLCNFIDLVGMSLLGQRGNRDIWDVVDIHKGLGQLM